MVGCSETAVPVYYGHFSFLRKCVEAISQFFYNAVFPGNQFFAVNGGWPEFEASRLHLSRFFDHASGVQQRFGWYATHVEANASKCG